MTPHVDRARLDATLASFAPIDSTTDPGTAISRVLHAAHELFALEGIGLMLLDPAHALRYVGASDTTARRLELLQEEIGEGPCVSAFVDDTLTQTADLPADARWPRLAARLQRDPIHAVLGVPTRVAGTPVGTLNAYAARSHAWDDSDRRAVGAFNGIVENVLTLALAQRRASLLVEQLEHALANRVTIERAVGYLMSDAGVPASVAFGRLRAQARRERRRVAELAAEILAIPGQQ